MVFWWTEVALLRLGGSGGEFKFEMGSDVADVA